MLVTGKAPDEFVMHHDQVWEELIKPAESDESTEELLKLLFTSLSSTTQRLLLDHLHLPGGIYHSDTMSSHPDTTEEVLSVPTTNVAPERDFAILDRLLREKPNTTLRIHDATSKWLQQQTQEDKGKIIRTRVPIVRQKEKERKEAIATRCSYRKTK